MGGWGGGGRVRGEEGRMSGEEGGSLRVRGEVGERLLTCLVPRRSRRRNLERLGTRLATDIHVHNFQHVAV